MNLFLNNFRKNHLSELIESVVGVTTTSQEANLLILLSTCSNCLFQKKDNAFSKKIFQDISYVAEYRTAMKKGLRLFLLYLGGMKNSDAYEIQ